MAQDAPELLTSLLKQVSRSFYLTLRVLPARIRPQIGLAYLLARATDTIADTNAVPVPVRLEALRSLRERILGRETGSKAPADPKSVPTSSPDPASSTHTASPQVSIPVTVIHSNHPSCGEQILLTQLDQMLRLLDQFILTDQKLIRQVLQTITSGQILDLERFGTATVSRMGAVQTDQELDDYTYRVAGCVGEFWTHICRAHLSPKTSLNEEEFLAKGVQFGKGLQLVNILRDLPSDLRQGRCYLPLKRLSQFGLTPVALLEVRNEPVFRPMYEEYLGQAQAYLVAGWAYTNALPWSCMRLRLACAWPLLIGTQTLQRLHSGNVLDPAHRIKVSRSDVRKLISLSLLYYPWPRAWNLLFFKWAGTAGASGHLRIEHEVRKTHVGS